MARRAEPSATWNQPKAFCALGIWQVIFAAMKQDPANDVAAHLKPEIGAMLIKRHGLSPRLCSGSCFPCPSQHDRRADSATLQRLGRIERPVNSLAQRWPAMAAARSRL